MKTVDVLAVVDGLDNLLLVNVLRQRQLDDKAVNVAVLVQAVYAGQQFLFRHVGLIADECRFKTASFACEHLIFHISLRTTVVAHQYRCQVRLFATLSHNLFYLFSNLSLNGRCCCFSVNQGPTPSPSHMGGEFGCFLF